MSRKVVAVDFDFTLCEDGNFGDPAHDVAEYVRECLYRGHFVVIYTARPWEDKQRIEAWLGLKGIWADAVICGKLRFDLLIDDKAHNSVEAYKKFLTNQPDSAIINT